jgi:probable F420-dependent oxidoreductase
MTHARPFRFGAGAFIAGSAAQWREMACRVEAQGYDTLLVPDHFGQQFSPGPALIAAAMATTTLRVGVTVYANDYRHPVVLAKEVASIDVLCDGRLEFGIGAGWTKSEYDELGIPFDPPGVRVERMREAARIVRGVWADGPFSFTGQHYTIDGHEGWPKPVQRPGPPLMIGAGGKQLLSFAAREADTVGIVAQALPEGGLDTGADTEARVEEKVGWVREAAGDRFGDIELAMLIWAIRVTDDVRTGAEDIARTRWTPITAEQVLASPYYLIGGVDHIADRLSELRERFGFSYFSVFPEDVEAFAPVVARLAGT